MDTLRILMQLKDKKGDKAELQNTITEIKKKLHQKKSIADQIIEKCIYKLEDRLMEVTQAKQKEEEKFLKNQNSLRDLWENINHD